MSTVVELQDLEAGSYTLTPKIEVSSAEPVSVQSVMPPQIAVDIKPIETEDSE